MIIIPAVKNGLKSVFLLFNAIANNPSNYLSDT